MTMSDKSQIPPLPDPSMPWHVVHPSVIYGLLLLHCGVKRPHIYPIPLEDIQQP